MRMLWRWLASFRRRILFRTVFLLLMVATVALAVAVLQQEKQLSYEAYRKSLRKTEAQLLAKLHHPSGQLALLNPQAHQGGVTPLKPLVLPYSAIDFDDPHKAQQTVELAGCLVQYPRHGALCVTVPHTAWAGGFLYIAGSFASGELVPRARGELDVTTAHRVRLIVSMRGRTEHWVAPFEQPPQRRAREAESGRLTGFAVEGASLAGARPSREFRGWLWQDRDCIQGAAPAGCLRRAFFSMRLPVEALREAVFDRSQRGVWPPPDLDRMVVHLQVLPPGDGAAPLLDSDDPEAMPPFSLQELKSLLLPGETLRVLRLRPNAPPTSVLTLVGDETAAPSRPWLDQLVRKLLVEGDGVPIEAQDTVSTPLGPYRVVLTGDLRSVDARLAGVATRMVWFVGAMLLAIVLAWLIIEAGLIRRIGVLTRRARAVSRDVTGARGVSDLQVADLRGSDELGILAGALSDLLQRVREDTQRERLRAERERDLWHAVGHEIMSPLQSLMALHGGPDDPSRRYLQRMQQAVRVLYGSASPSEAFETSTLELQAMDLHQFLRHVAANAPHAGIECVVLEAEAGLGEVIVRADEHSLEDVVAHVLRNAGRYRVPGTDITLRLRADAASAEVEIHNQGPPIAPELMDKIFEYGVSDPASGEGGTHRGQGLFVAKTYMAKMGGTIRAHNVGGGVAFVLALPRAGG
ncbi:MAG: HAMP domain-containing sensor histidine kinase [Pseudomonadota bacterium]